MSTYEQQYEAVINSDLNLANFKRQERYRRNDVIWFFSSKDDNWELSNMAGGMPIFFDNQRFHSTEQLYQACKYEANVICTPEDKKDDPLYIKNIRERVLASKNARGAKMTQKCGVKAGMVRDDWEDGDFEIRIHSMLWVLELKLYYNRLNFGKLLQETGNMQIVEVSKKDKFWGCVYENSSGCLEGYNVLGKLLMSVRDSIAEIKSGDFSYPDGFLLR